MDQTSPVNPTPQPQAPPPTPVDPPQSPYSLQSTTPSKSPMPLIIGLIIGVLALIGGAIWAYMAFFSDNAQAQSTSNTFMTHITKNEVDKAVKLASSQDQNTKTFLTAASEDASGNYTLKEKQVKDGKGYFLYTLPDAKSTHARVTLGKKDGKWVVAGYVYSKNELKLVPDSSTTSETPSTTTPTTACLASSDLAPLSGGVTPAGVEMGDEHVYWLSAIFFQPDSTAYNFSNQMTEQLAKIGTFYENNKNKAFTIHLVGKVKESAASAVGEKLAHDRVEKVKADLVALGIPADRFVEDTPTRSAASDSSERNVNMSIHKKLNCTENTSNSGR